MNIVSIKTIFEKVKAKYGQSLEHFKFYDIKDLGLKVKTPNGFSKLISFVIKPGRDAKVHLSDGNIISCSDKHYLTTPDGSFQVNQLRIGDFILKESSIPVTISNIEIFETVSDYYDVEIDDSNHLFYTANGICHHNTGKTHMVEKVLADLGLQDGAGYFKNTGSASASGIYRLLHDHKDGIVLFDDSDDALKDQESRNIFKAATDTKKKRKLAWSKSSSVYMNPEDMEDSDYEEGKLPKYFDFTGKIIFISNLPLDKLDPDRALRTRAFTPEIDPTNTEIFDFMAKIADTMTLEDNLTLDSEKRKKVVEWLRTSKSGQAPNLRMLVRGLNMAAGGEAAGVPETDYKKMIIRYA